MRAGALYRQIVIEQVAEARSSTGDVVATWSTFATVRAQHKPASGREYHTSDEKNAEVDSVFITRYLSGVLPKMRISYDGRYYDIYSIKEIGRQQGLEILAKAVVA